MTRRKRLPETLLAAALVLVFAGQGTVQGHSDATGVVKERMELMERYETLIERLFAMAHGELPVMPEVATAAAREIRQTAGDHMVRLFPGGSLQEPSEASPDIWRHPHMFARYAQALQIFAAELENTEVTPASVISLPAKWEDVPAQRAMMMSGRDVFGRGGGLSPDAGAYEAALWQVARTCNSCHALFRIED